MKPIPILCASALAAICCGCQSVAPPQLLGVSDAQTQRRQAVAFDPYGSNDVGPSVAETRPPGYDRPPNSTTASRRFLNSVGVAPAP